MINFAEMTEFVYDKTKFEGRIAVILGSGLSPLADSLENPKTVSYKEIPYFPESTVEGHIGELVAGNFGNVEVLAAKGRFHYYEGHEIETVTLPIQLYHRLGVNHLIITNAAGSMRTENPPGTLLAVDSHMDCTFRHNADEPIIWSGIPYHDPDLLNIALDSAEELNINLPTGCYCWTLGPTYETPAEIEYFKSLGGDAVGMSTIPEIVAAGELGMKILTISLMTNYAAGISDQPLTHAEVTTAAHDAGSTFSGFLEQIILKLGENV